MDLRRPFLCALLVFGGILGFAEDRSFDGSGNNISNPSWGMAGAPFVRIASAAYADGMNMMGGTNRPNPRVISNAICPQTNDLPNTHNMSDMVWQWGQFIDHDVVLSLATEEFEPIMVPAGDEMFDPDETGSVMLPFNRTEMMPGTGSSTPREQINSNTSFIDASMVYGSSAAVANQLRTFVGGKLLLGPDRLLPKNIMGVPVDNPTPLPDTEMFATGEFRANEHAGLTSMHTLFAWEHNRLCDQLVTTHPGWNDEQLYQRARKLVGAHIQSITYNEWLPELLGSYAPGSAGSYDPAINPGIANEFAAALFRVGHTMINDHLMRVRPNNLPASGGPFALKDVFFNPLVITGDEEVEMLLKGLASRRMQHVDSRIVEDLRSFLFGSPGSGGLDLGALNVQRGRDHGLPNYNALRVAYGPPANATMADITSDSDMSGKLLNLFGNVNNIDSWVGAITEDHVGDAAVGELIAVGLAEQFTRLRDGDRFYYKFDPDLSPSEIAVIDATRLAHIIRRNTGITRLQANVFTVIPEARVRISSLEQTNFQLNLEWMTDVNASYQIEVSSDVDASTWAPLSATFDGNGAMNQFITVNGGPLIRFYRLRQYP